MKKPKINKFEFQDEWPNWVSKEIVKHSGKPFKSGKLVGVTLGMEPNPNSGKMGFKMDDGSIVDCFQCKLLSM